MKQMGIVEQGKVDNGALSQRDAAGPSASLQLTNHQNNACSSTPLIRSVHRLDSGDSVAALASRNKHELYLGLVLDYCIKYPIMSEGRYTELNLPVSTRFESILKLCEFLITFLQKTFSYWFHN